MKLQPYYERLSEDGSGKLNFSSGVECRTGLSPSEVKRLLCVSAVVSPIGVECLLGEVRYSGRVIFAYLYISSAGELIRGECGVEFSSSGKNAEITASTRSAVTMSVTSSDSREANGAIVLSATVDAEISLYSERQTSFLSGGDGLICDLTETEYYSTTGGAGSLTVEEEIEYKSAIS